MRGIVKRGILEIQHGCRNLENFWGERELVEEGKKIWKKLIVSVLARIELFKWVS